MRTKFRPFILSRIDKMKFQIKIGTAVAMVTYITAFLYLISPGLVISNLTTIRIIGWVVAATLATYLVLGDLHNWLDKKLFHERAKVDSYIREQLTKPCLGICQRAKDGILKKEEPSLINLFYTFITADDTERERAFSYFTEYFITVNLTALSFLGFIVAISVAVIVPPSTMTQYLILGTLAILFPFISNYLRIRVRRKLQLPAVAQSARILSRDISQLNSLLPSYRYYDGSTICKDSTQCPLVTKT